MSLLMSGSLTVGVPPALVLFFCLHFLIWCDPQLPLVLITILLHMIPRPSSPSLYRELQSLINNCLLGISIWMSLRHLKLSTSNAMHLSSLHNVVLFQITLLPLSFQSPMFAILLSSSTPHSHPAYVLNQLSNFYHFYLHKISRISPPLHPHSHYPNLGTSHFSFEGFNNLLICFPAFSFSPLKSILTTPLKGFS